MNKSSQIIRISTLFSIFVSWFILLAASALATDLDVAFAPHENCAFSNVTVADHQIAVHNVAGWWKLDMTALTSQLPAQTHIDALDYLYGPTTSTTTTNIVFSLAEDAVLPGVGLVADEDLLLWNGSTIGLLWDGSANGIPPEANVDALDVRTFSTITEYSLSFAEAVTLPTVGLVQKSDVVRWTAGSGFSATKEIDGVARGIPLEANVDGFSRETATNIWVLSTDIASQLQGTWYSKSDLINFYYGTDTFALRASGSGFGIPAEVNLGEFEVKSTEIPVELSRFLIE